MGASWSMLLLEICTYDSNSERECPQNMNMVCDIYRTRICHWCRKHLKDGDKIYYLLSDSSVILCEDDKYLLETPPDFDVKGSREQGTTSWKTARILTLIRDDCHCRVCGEHYKRENPVDVHHIIPRKDGGTHNLKNLVTLCERHHKETFKNGYAGLKVTDFLVSQNIQRRLLEVEK